MECNSETRKKCTWGLHQPGFGSYCTADYPNCYQVLEYDEPEKTNLQPIYINVDHAAVPGHVLIMNEDWYKILDVLKQLTVVREFNEKESAFMNHQRGVCKPNCPMCDEERALRLRNADRGV